jgi:TonB family protein
MFTQLLASQPVRQKSTGGLVVSIVMHLLLATGVVYATTKTVQVIQKDQPTDLVYQPPEPPELVTKIEIPPTAPSEVPSVTTVVEIPVSLPPLPEPGTLTPTTMVRPLGVVATWLAPAAPKTPTTLASSVFRENEVEVPVSLAGGSPTPRYPASLASTGIDGAARFRFVVDTAGRVELGTVERIASSHSAFAQSVLSTLPRMRFTPARVDGRPVRQLVELPFEFRTKR